MLSNDSDRIRTGKKFLSIFRLNIYGLLSICLAVLFAGATVAAAGPAADCVILLHGLGRTEASLSKIEKVLTEKGYRIWNEEYASRDADIETLAENHISIGVHQCEEWKTVNIHFVTHSLGGILIRQYLQTNTIDNLGKIVMLAPPNHGSEVVDHLQDASIFQSTMGPAGQQLSTHKFSKPNTLEPIPGTIGVIAGSANSDPWFAWMFTGPNDGKVSVESTRLSEMSDFLVVDNGHTFIMNNREVIQQVLFFLEHGKFKTDRQGNRFYNETSHRKEQENFDYR